MAHRLYAILALAVLVCCTALPASAEVAIPGYISSPSAASSAPSELDPTPSPTAPPDISDSAISADTRYSASEITDILREHPNAFTVASETKPESPSSMADQLDSSADEQDNSDDSNTIWEKPFNSYSPTEGYLLILTVLALSVAVFKLVKYLWL